MTTVQCYESSFVGQICKYDFQVFDLNILKAIDNHCFRTSLHMIIVFVF
jgi:hypothetical protein